MTDHPSNPPSQERITAAAIQVEGVIYTGPHHATIVHYVAKCAGIKPVKGPQGFVTSLGRFVDRADALPIAIAAGQVGADCKTVGGLFSEMLWIMPEDSALAAQEARHKAEIEKYREELVQISVWLPNHGGIGATVLTQVQTAVLEAESKLRQATEALGEVAIPTLRYCERKFGIDDQARLNCEAAIRSGQAQQAAEMAMGGSYEGVLAAAFEAVKALADYPPEQETPKPEEACVHGIYPAWKCGNCGIGLGVPDPPKPRGLMSLRGIAPDITGDLSSEEYLKLNWAGEIVYCACGRPTAGPAQCSKCAPPAHGGGD